MLYKKIIRSIFLLILLGLTFFIFIKINGFHSGTSFYIDNISLNNKINVEGGNPILNEKRIYFENAFFIFFVSIDFIIIIFNSILNLTTKMD